MKIYWKFPVPPELEGLSIAERERIWKESWREKFRNRKAWLGLLACGIFPGLGAYIGSVTGIGIWGAAIGGGIGGFVFNQFSIRSALEVIREKYALPDSSEMPEDGFSD